MPASGEVFQFTFRQTIAGQTIENVLHFRERSAASTNAQQDAAAEAYLALTAPVQSTNLLYSSVLIKQMTPLALDERVFLPITTTNGHVSENPINNTLAMILTKRTGTAGKRHRGRVYFGGVPASFVATGENLLSTTGAAAMATLAAGLLGAFGESGTDPNFVLGVYSRSIGGYNPFTVAGWQEITRWDIQNVLGNQRRRRVGVGI